MTFRFSQQSAPLDSYLAIPISQEPETSILHVVDYRNEILLKIAISTHLIKHTLLYYVTVEQFQQESIKPSGPKYYYMVYTLILGVPCFLSGICSKIT